MKPFFTPSSRRHGMTMVELLVVIAILGILVGLLVPGLGKAKEVAEAMKNTANLKQIAVGTISWAADNSSRLPSPQYPGGMTAPPGVDEEDFYPEYYNIGQTGLWLDGVIFAELYLKEGDTRSESSGEEGEGRGTGGYNIDADGDHLKGTLFESTQSVKKDPLEKNWHKHSYAMNANLQYDRIYDQVDSSDPYLTEKTLANLIFSPRAMLFIDCIDSNVVRFEDRQLIVDTMEKRWDGGKAIVAFLDGHAERLAESEIPDEDPESDRESSRFWRGVDPK